MASGTNKSFARATKKHKKAMKSLSVKPPLSPEEKMDCGQISTAQTPKKPLHTLTAAPMEIGTQVTKKPHKPAKPEVNKDNKENVPDPVIAQRMAMNLVGILVDENFNMMDTCLKHYIPLMTKEGKSQYLAAVSGHRDKNFSDVMRELQEMEAPPEDSISQAINGNGAFQYMSITVDFFLDGLSHINPNLAHDAIQVLKKMENSARAILEAQKKASEVSPNQTHSPRNDTALGEIIEENMEVIEECCEAADGVLDALSFAMQLDREEDPVLQHYSERIKRILFALADDYKP